MTKKNGDDQAADQFPQGVPDPLTDPADLLEASRQVVLLGAALDGANAVLDLTTRAVDDLRLQHREAMRELERVREKVPAEAP